MTDSAPDTHEPADPADPPALAAPERWYITTEFFRNGGKVYDDWGPFPSGDLAMRVRALIEQDKGRYDLFVDKR